MEHALIIAAVSTLHGAVIMLVVCVGARGGGMERNHTVGIRIWSTTSSHRAWAAGHGAAVPWCWAGVVLSGIFLITAVVLHQDDEGLSEGLRQAVLGFGIGSVVVVLLLAIWAADRAAKRILVEEHLEEEYGPSPPDLR